MDNRYLNIKQAAKILGVSTLTLRNWDNNGKFPAGRHPISNYRVYKIQDIEDLLNRMDNRFSPKNRDNSGNGRKLSVNHL